MSFFFTCVCVSVCVCVWVLHASLLILCCGFYAKSHRWTTTRGEKIWTVCVHFIWWTCLWAISIPFEWHAHLDLAAAPWFSLLLMFIAFRAFNLMSASKLPNDETLNGIATRAVLIRPANQFANAHELRWATHFSLAHIPYFIYFLLIFYFSSAFPLSVFFFRPEIAFLISLARIAGCHG